MQMSFWPGHSEEAILLLFFLKLLRKKKQKGLKFESKVLKFNSFTIRLAKKIHVLSLLYIF